MGGSASFFDVTVRAGADNVRPDGLSAHASGDDVVERQLTCGLFFPAILTAVLVAGEDVSAVEFHLGAGQAVVEQQADDFRDCYVEIDRRDPVVAVGLETAFEFADLAPALEVVVGVSAFLTGNHFGQLPAEQRKCPPGVDDANRHIVLVEDKHVTVKTGFELCGQHSRRLPRTYLPG